MNLLKTACLLILTVFAGCVTPPVPPSPPPVKNDPSLIIVNDVNRTITVTVTGTGSRTFVLREGQSVSEAMAPGQYTVTAESSEAKLGSGKIRMEVNGKYLWRVTLTKK